MGNRQVPKKILVAVTGASGMLYLQSFLTAIADLDLVVHGICSEAGQKVLGLEKGISPQDLPTVSAWFDCRDFAAPPASGSSGYDAMLVLPCSMGTLAAIAAGISANLIQRCADVMLKERKDLVLVVRETPFNRTHLKNMLAVHDAGAIICPPMPGYYLQPASLEEAADTFSWRLADQIGLDIPGRRRWGTEESKC
ncbi:MAG: UbiX family flavin prenyltransferase [Proteobacteria bacterium]|nr:UbiX family flavin prenyltransferase [Desulfocapsa sp.]MBU3946233.1 UbiX family flavin prenyltransferase [Pseudomonadota bacterium]MCG2745375.1 UbiX family flavin prenyltransferase [Desulfobacteraceae bacterium]MDO8948018.1 UbiX family flavin prenyltransferase [Desulfocapsaceae bacterium]MBU3984336.1 UbiX family flavin prenyltransferase [Pseudomonadota bacterium]